MAAKALFLETALLPDGWARNVRVEIAGGGIVAVAPDASPEGAERIAGVTLPGLASLHSHTFQRGMAGLAETRGPTDDSFWSWRQVMYRFLDALTPEDVEAIAAFAFMEMLEAGFTAVAEFHYLHHDRDGRPYADLAEMCGRIAAAAGEAGIGLTLLPALYAQGGFGGAPSIEGQRRFLNNPDRFLRLVEGAGKAVGGLPDASIGIAPHSLRAVTPEALQAVLDARPRDVVHMHVAEQMREVEDCLAWSGQRPVEWLLAHAPVDERWCLIHATHMTPVECRALAATGAVAGLCPITEANLGDGVFPAAGFIAAGGRYGVGTDSNVQIDAVGELRQLEYSQRLALRGRNILARAPGESTGARLYRDALAGGAQATGRRIGAIAPGMRADLVVLDGAHPDIAAAEGDRVLDAFVFVVGRAAIRNVVVGGASVVVDGRHRARAAIVRRYVATMARIATGPL
jgi:formimidoylglutamate deiminase